MASPGDEICGTALSLPNAYNLILEYPFYVKLPADLRSMEASQGLLDNPKLREYLAEAEQCPAAEAGAHHAGWRHFCLLPGPWPSHLQLQAEQQRV